MKLLLIDDDAFLRDMYAIKFTEGGHTVAVADGATAALRVIEQSVDFDVVLLDMIMPGMSGTELMRKIRKEFPAFGAKFIVLSNQGQAEDIKDATEAGAIGYIVKAEAIPSEVVTKVVALIKS